MPPLSIPRSQKTVIIFLVVGEGEAKSHPFLSLLVLGPFSLSSAWGPLRCSSTALLPWSQSFHSKNLCNGLQIWLCTKYHKELILEAPVQATEALETLGVTSWSPDV